MMASRIAFRRSSLRWRKKLTVIGMIGQTQGVRIVMSPPTKPMRKMYQSVRLCVPPSSPQCLSCSMEDSYQRATSEESAGATTGATAAVSVVAMVAAVSTSILV